MAYNVREKEQNYSVIDEIEQYRIDTIRSLILQGLENKQQTEFAKKAFNRALEILKEKNDSFMYNITIEKTDLTFADRSRQDMILYPCVYRGKEFNNLHIGELQIGEDLPIFNGEHEENDPFFMRSKPLWIIKGVILVEVINKDDSIIIYSEDCKRYKISFELSGLFNIFDEEEISVE